MSQSPPPTPSSSEDVQKALSFFIDLFPAFVVNDDGIVLEKASKTPHLVGPGETKRQVHVYGPNLPSGDEIIVNPLAEGLGDRSQGQIFFYSTINNSLAIRMLEVIVRIVNAGWQEIEFVKAHEKEAKKAKGKKSEDFISTLPREYQDVLAVKVPSGKSVIEELDEKSYAEIDKYLRLHLRSDAPSPIIAARYVQRSMSAYVTCPAVDDPEFTEATPGIRVKSLHIIRAIACHVLDAHSETDLKKFGISAVKVDNVPEKMYSILSVIFNVLTQINPYLDAAESPNTVDLGEMSYHIKHIPNYMRNASYMVQPSASLETRPVQTPAGPMSPAAMGVGVGEPLSPTGGPPAQPIGLPTQTTLPTLPTQSGGPLPPGVGIGGLPQQPQAAALIGAPSPYASPAAGLGVAAGGLIGGGGMIGQSHTGLGLSGSLIGGGSLQQTQGVGLAGSLIGSSPVIGMPGGILR